MLIVDNFFKNKGKLTYLLYFFIITGISLRIFHYFYNRSLWMDEIYLSTSFLKMNYADLASQPLYYQQKAPIGFLWLIKLTTQLFGNTELSLRFISLISGIGSIFLFVPVSRYFVSKSASVLAIGILCLSPALVYHSVEIKQYAIELFATILSLYLFIKFNNTHKTKDILLWGIIGAIILWFSYASIFILAGIGISLGIKNLKEKNVKVLLIKLFPFVFWLLSFLLNYFLFTHKHAESKWITYWFRSYHNFMPFPPTSLMDVKWFFLNSYQLLDYPLGLLWNFNGITDSKSINIFLKLPFIPLSLLALGIYSFLKKSKRISSILITPILLTLIASGLELYPLTERFWVFISPIFILIIANGFNYITQKTTNTYLKVFCFVMVIIPPLVQSAFFLIIPEKFYVHKKSYQREVLLYVNTVYKNSDAVYVYWNNLPGYKLYKIMYPLKYTATEGADHRTLATGFNDYYKKLDMDISKLSSNQRVWVIFNHQFLTDIGDKIDEPAWYYKNGNPTQHLLKAFLKIGKPVKSMVTSDVSAYLFEIKNK